MKQHTCISVLHITAHLGGGIGKALSGLVRNTSPESRVSHTVVCLEQPEKTHFLETLTKSGCHVVVAPETNALHELIQEADIVQVEWWGHPATTAALCGSPLPPMRLLIWCHVSGINTPIIPSALIESAHACIFTSPCSYLAPEVARLHATHGSMLDVIHSAGGFDGFEMPRRCQDDRLNAGYLGSLTFAKLHPRYVDYLSSVGIRDFSVSMIGDITNREMLKEQCEKAGNPGLLKFLGYTTDVPSALASMDIFPYLLNPLHYGTTENALLEAMAMGVVPIVLDNPAERCLVADRTTGFIIRNPCELSDVVHQLRRNPEERRTISRQAAASVRKRFSAGNTSEAFTTRYKSMRKFEKKVISFKSIFGPSPAEWFLSLQRQPDIFLKDDGCHVINEFNIHGLMEKSKGSVFHYRNFFPDNAALTQWAQRIETVAGKQHITNYLH